MNILDVANSIKINGGKLYLVGGAVRDKLMNTIPSDKDYVVTGLSSSEFESLFPNAIIRGKDFPVYDFLDSEFALARIERKTGVGHKAFEFNTNKDISIEEDLKRRDLTINSIAKDVLTNEIIDPYHGTKDIKNRIIKATSLAFSEDPLRVYRAAVFATRFNFEVNLSTIKLMSELKLELSSITPERVFAELRKALSCDKPSIFFRVLNKANVLDIHFKEVFNLIGALQPEKYHPEGDSFEHTMIVLDKIAAKTNALPLRFSALMHDIGKGATPKEKYPHHYDHDILGIKLINDISKRLKIPTSWEKSAKVACKEHMRGGMFYKMSSPKQVDFLVRVSKSIIGLDGLQLIVDADRDRGLDIYENHFFSGLGKEMLNEINGEYIKSLGFHENDYIKFNDKLREERIKWIKNRDIY